MTGRRGVTCHDKQKHYNYGMYSVRVQRKLANLEKYLSQQCAEG